MEVLTETPPSSGRSGCNKSANILLQTGLLLKKNWLTKIRQDKKTLVAELLLPILYLCILCLVVLGNKRYEYLPQTEPFESKRNVIESLSLLTSPVIHIVPDNDYTRRFTNVMKDLYLSDTIYETNALQFMYYANESELLEKYRATDNINSAIILPDEGDPLIYTIKTKPNYYLPSITKMKEEISTCRGRSKFDWGLEDTTTCPVNGYYFSDFLALQSLVDQAYIKMHSANNTGTADVRPPKVTIENYPKREYTSGMPTILRVLIPVYSVIPVAQLINTLLVLIVTEKENKIKDGLKMIGISDAAYWISWFGTYGTITTIYSLVFTLVMYFMNILSHINPLILFVLFCTFGFSVITFAFALTPFFHKPKTAGIFGSTVLLLIAMLFMVQTFVSGSGPWLVPLHLISSLAFTTALDTASQYEFAGGIHWSDLKWGGRGEGVLCSILFLLGDTVLYGLLALYLDNVLPNEFGVKKHPLFCFMPSYWFGSKVNISKTTPQVSPYGSINSENFEPIPQSLQRKEAINTINVKKSFITSWFGSQTTEAVKGISLKIYEGQITAILGRNGAGKSTLFNMITGMVSPTSGTNIVYGYDVNNPYGMSQIRKMTGVCMQTNLHFNTLTVKEHLEFYGRLRGLQKDELASEVNVLLGELKLKGRKNTAAEKLSAGEKRKLSVGLALIGDPKIILLDEPSAGVDPVSRRDLWSLLQRKKEGKVILLATHFLDEADILADRKAIIHDGVLKCCGTSLFLKNKFGVGYHLNVELDSRSSKRNGNKSDEVVDKWIPNALASKKVISNEIKYSLPNSEISRFPGLFADIESLVESPNSGIKSYGVSMTTLEEVFLRISNNAEQVGFVSDVGEHSGVPSRETNLIADVGELQQNPIAIMTAMIKLRILRMLRSFTSLVYIVLLPIIFVVIGISLDKAQKISSASTKLNFSDPGGIYPQSDLNIALSELSSDYSGFSNFLRQRGFEVYNYSGKFEDLLDVNPDVGTMGAITLLEGNSGEISVNGTFLHGPPILLNVIDEYYFSKSQRHGRLEVTNYPFISKNPVDLMQSPFYIVFLIGPASIMIAAAMIIEIVNDRRLRTKNHLRVNGLSLELYFGSMFTVYGVLSLLVTISQIVLISIFALPSFSNPYAITILTCQLILYIFPCLLFSAVFSYLFDRPESAQTIFYQIASFSGTLVIFVVIILDTALPDSNAALIVHTLFCALDVFYIPLGIFYSIHKQYRLCYLLESCSQLSFANYSGPEFMVIWVCMTFQIPIFIGLLYIADMAKDGGKVQVLSFFKKYLPNRISIPYASLQKPIPMVNSSHEEDTDVSQERQKVASALSKEGYNGKCVVAVEDLTKHYMLVGGKEKKLCTVLDRVSFAIEKGEVFGLLGHNGAAKTTAMKIITGEINPYSGRVQLCGYDISSNKSEAFRKLGYCPQNDVLWENIKLKEHIELYAALRGVPSNKIQLLVNSFLDGLNIQEHANKKARELSGGTKRKLSYAMSMLGNPRIVLLDEPSTGMDPQSKRFLWNTVLGTFKDTRGAMITTHAMEEADALCTRIAIMVKGVILCIGSPQHLKSKFGTGYTLEIIMKSEIDDVDDTLHETHEDNFEFIFHNFPGCKLSEVFGNRAVFSIPNSSIQSISKTFALLEQLKEKHCIGEYAFSQTTLEQVFLSFAKENEKNEAQKISQLVGSVA